MNSFAVRTILVVAVLGLAVVAVDAETIPASSARIVQVTVFPDRAEIVREARVEVPAGDSAVEFAEIPPGVEPDSLRVSASGVQAALGAVTLADRVAEARETPELIAARDEVRRLEDGLATIESERRVDQELHAFLVSIGAAAAAGESAKLGENRADPAAVAGLFDVLQSKHTQLSARTLEHGRRERGLRKELELARAKLALASPGSGIRSRVATVEIDAARAGALTLRLAYVAPGASWRPSYRAVLEAETGNVHLVSEGVVRQNTGENWSDVRLSLSTASPATGAAPPVLAAWLVRPAEPEFQRAQEGFAKVEAEARPVPGRVYQNVLGLAPGAHDEAPDEPSQTTESEIVRSAYNVVFEVVGRSEVPSDGQDHRVVLRNEDLTGKIVHRTVPSADPRAYLTSVTTSPADYPLLGGPVRVFAGGAYLGSFAVDETGPGTEWTVPFGVDNRLEVVRVPLPREAGREGLGGRQRTLDVAFKTTITNRLGRKATAVLEDRIPVSEDERIVVELDKGTTAGWKPSERRPGVMLWTIELEVGEQREIVLAYSVRHPRELIVPGLE